jgi:hypothetical protein
MIAEAAQRYGIIVRDYAGAVVFYSEDPVPSGNYILRQMLGGQSPAQALSSFPWSRLQAMDPVQPPAPEDPAPVADPAPVPDPGAAPPADQVLTPPASPPPVAPPASGPLAHAVAPVAPVAPRASAGRRQRIATVLRHGIRVTCKQRPGALCAVRVRIGHVVVLTGARRLAPRGRTIVPTRVTRAGRRLLVRSRRHSGTLTVSVRGGGRVTRRLTFVR